MDAQPLLELRHITKTLARVAALDDFSLEVRPNEIHAVVGEVGAGKTTLMKILGGLYPAGSYEGEIRLQGRPVVIGSPAEAIRRGIAVVPRKLSVFDQLSVAENIVVGHWENLRGFFIRSGDVYQQAQAAIDRLHVRLPLDAQAGQLTTGQKRLLMIARAISTHPQLIVLDEPTTSLTTSESLTQLIYVVRRLPTLDVACLYLSRRLNDALTVADRVTILRDGAAVGVSERAHFDEAEMAKAMVSQRLGDGEYADEDEAEEPQGIAGMFRNLFSGRR